jgi:hypothetical protein
VASRDTQDVLIFEVPTLAAANVRDTQDVLIFEVPTIQLSLAYPLTAPGISGIGPQDFTLNMENVIGEAVSPFTLSDQEQQWPGQMFTIEANLPPMPYPQAEQWIAFLGALFGKFGTFLMGDYNRPTPQGPMSGSPVVNGVNPSGSQQLLVRGATPSVTGWAVAGDYLQVTAVGGQQRIHKVLLTANTDVSGDVSLAIFPSIREALADGTTVVTANCAGTFRLQENTTTWKIDRNRMYSISFKAREALLQ